MAAWRAQDAAAQAEKYRLAFWRPIVAWGVVSVAVLIPSLVAAALFGWGSSAVLGAFRQPLWLLVLPAAAAVAGLSFAAICGWAAARAERVADLWPPVGGAVSAGVLLLAALRGVPR
ncbi:hypothetical protein DOO78_19550 [Roseicella frigidaeris]|uniref:Uncharacterized protein n=1 Tax=Roseicella frigidaeris TaxID=2230885 RepID=A0A327M4S3_9PROT|nr:hypothetical protein DOO78_19550 [Roseicella frigidaeris]